MNVFFGASPSTEGREGFIVANNKGTLFDYRVEYGSGNGGITDIVIHDICGRSVPVFADCIPELMDALAFIHNKHTSIKTLAATEKAVSNPETSHVITRD